MTPENEIDALIVQADKAALSAAHDDCGLLSDLADAMKLLRAVALEAQDMRSRNMLLTNKMGDALKDLDKGIAA